MKTSERPDKILMTADTVGGVWNYALELTAALGKYDIEVHMATMGNKLNADQRHDTGMMANLTIHQSEYKLEWMPDPWKSVEKSGKWLLDIADRIKPDLVHLNTYTHGNLPWNIPVLMVGHSCVTSWWQAVKKREAPDAWTHYKSRVRSGLQHADCVISVSRYMLNCLQYYYGPFQFADVIHNAREESRYHVASKEPVILSMGRIWDEGKNLSMLADISGELPWPVYIAGDDDGRMAENSNVHLLGHLNNENIARWAGKAPIYVMPARYEPFGLSVLEAAHSGCALVLGDIPPLREIWEDTALFADPNNRDDLKQQILKLIEDQPFRARMAEAAKKQAQKFLPEKFARRYIHYYRTLLRSETKALSGITVSD